MGRDLDEMRSRLLEQFRGLGGCAVAFSGGVDSAVVAKAAHLALGDRAVAVTANSPSLAQRELEDAVQVAQHIGIRHRIIATHEVDDPAYMANTFDRCYFCKSELYTQLQGMLGALQVETIVNGANLDDLGDHRPGLRAATEHEVASPLAECGFTKADVRALAEVWELAVWDKPASPCLSSRIAYGEQVTPERLRMIDAAETFLRDLGLREVRVRFHRDALARIEVPASEIISLVEPATRTALLGHFRRLGFRYVTLDLAGFQSGSMNRVIPLDALQPPANDRQSP